MDATSVSSVSEFRFGSAQQAAEAAAEEVASLLADGILRRGHASLAVSGGRSPIPFFQVLSRSRLEWSKVTITLVDERWVDPTSHDSNEWLVRQHLLQNEARAARFVPLKTDAPTPMAGIAERTGAVAELLPFEAVVLGMGDDGHTASLFPGAVALEGAMDPTRDAILAAIDPPKAPYQRMTMTLSAIFNTRRIVLLFGGEHKHDLYVRATTDASPLDLPVGAVLNQRRVPVRVYWHAA